MVKLRERKSFIQGQFVSDRTKTQIKLFLASKCHVVSLDVLWHASLCLPLHWFCPYLLPTFLNNKEGIRAISNGEGEPVFEGVAAIMAVADTVLVDVFHGEGGGGLEMLPTGGLLDGAVAWELHNGECDRLGLSRR